ncbi:helix-turn-helix domain-containing protein [Halegenticoccus tardaugens]|uniref:helix-turn-helix domain-containing protein n=1 Tax=Halegenticoccus tardaugens TaxID=2071624 RepID=UPI00100C2D67|nr:bacterio-opsin activator domain-containing protein [Halegenticoccus tardaugens]
MSTIAELGLPADEFALVETFDRVESAEAEVERVVAFERDRVFPFVWLTADGADREAVDAALDADPSVENVQLLADLDDEWLYQMNWVSDVRVVAHILLDEDATVLTAVGRDDRWHLRVLFPDRASLSSTYDFCEREGFSLQVASIYDLDDRNHGQYGLTSEQHESLVTAAESGYYDIPREATLSDVAEELEISHQALSERLRRGHGGLVKNTLLVGPGPDDDLI